MLISSWGTSHKRNRAYPNNKTGSVVLGISCEPETDWFKVVKIADLDILALLNFSSLISPSAKSSKTSNTYRQKRDNRYPSAVTLIILPTLRQGRAA